MEFNHYTVMKQEAVDMLQISDDRKNKIYVDATLGGGGHSELILKTLNPDGHLFSFDIDTDAINFASERLKNYKNLTIIKDSYVNITKNLQSHNIEKITGGVIFDLGASYHQLTKQERGFSFMKEAPLDMRFDSDSQKTAFDVVNNYKEDELVKIFSEYGEERFSKRIAKKIVDERKKSQIKTTTQLADLIVDATPRIKSRIHPATRVFQALRIEVNSELTNVKNILENLMPFLDVGATISVISFHSLEDRLIKNIFRKYSRGNQDELTTGDGISEPPKLELLTKKPISASSEEIKINPPSRSAKLRGARAVR